MKTFLNLLSLVVVCAVLLPSCGQQDDAALQQGKDEVVVHLSAGDAAATSVSRAVFTERKPVKVFVYQRSDDDPNTAQYSKLYEEASGTVTTTASASSSDLSTVSFSGGNLTVEGGHTYDFLLVVNMPGSATVSNGVISDIPNDADIMVGRADGCYAPKGAYSMKVDFNKGYATDNNGNLPHLASKIIVDAYPDDKMVSGGAVKMGVGSVEFHGVRSKASFNFGATPMVGLTLGDDVLSSLKLVNTDLLTDQGNVNGDKLTQVSSTKEKATYDKGTLLPVPSSSGTGKNVMDIDFTVYFYKERISSTHTDRIITSSVLSAKSVELPEFKAGYEYTFKLVMEGKASSDPIKLYLSVKPWNNVDWDSGMGSDSDDLRLISVKVGSWSTTGWNATMGEEE